LTALPAASTVDAPAKPASSLAETVDFPDARAGATSSYHPTETVDHAPTPEQGEGEPPAQLGRFRLRQRLGEGTFGVVYRAYDPQLDREVALKGAKGLDSATPQRTQRFLREARAAANLRHPNIVPVHDSGQEGALYYIASAFIAGGSVDRLVKEKKLDRRQSVQIVRRVAEALAYAHRRGIVHRDIKPANVILDESGEPLLMDFGLAARAESGEEKLTQDGVTMGTPAYMAPEQVEGTGIASSDQYSLGCMLYELLTGRTPFQGPPQVQMRLHRTQEPPSPRQLQPDLPRDLETICLKCLEKDPSRRYPDCQALADDLRRWLEGEPILARPLGMSERLVKWARRNPAVAALTTAVFLALGLGLAGSLWQMDRANGEAQRADAKATEAANEATAARTAEKEAADNLTIAKEQKFRANAKATEAANEAIAARKAEKQAADNLTIAKDQRTRAELQTTRAETFLTRAEGLVYGGKLELVQEAFQNSNGVLALRYLEECQWDRRGWEHRHLWTRINSKRTFQGHTGAVSAVGFSPDGKRIVSGGGKLNAGGEIKVWDASTGVELLSLKGHAFGVNSVCFSPDGQRIVSGGGEDVDRPGEVKVWDAATGKLQFSLKGQRGWVRSVAFPTANGSCAAGETSSLVEAVAKSSSGMRTLASASVRSRASETWSTVCLSVPMATGFSPPAVTGMTLSELGQAR